jgi:hypothetical protein
MTGGIYYNIVNILGTPTILKNRLTHTQPQHMQCQAKTKPTSSQWTSSTYKSEVYWQLLTQIVQEAQTVLGVLNLGHLPDQTNSQTHLIVALYLLKPMQQYRLLHELSQEEEEMENLLQTLEIRSKTLSRLETPSTLHLDKISGPLMGLEDLTDLEALEDQEDEEIRQYPPLILFPFNQLEN